jgi:hypothetical protein
MGTRSNVYVETEPGTYVGTYCHYDGYPSHMLPTLTAIDNNVLLTHILLAAPQGGFRILQTHGTEYLDDYVNPCVLENPAAEDLGPEYVYIKCHDGSVKWRDTYGDYVNETGWRNNLSKLMDP